MANDSDGVVYQGMIDAALSAKPATDKISKAIGHLAVQLGAAGGLTTESTIAVAYRAKEVYVAKLGTVGPHKATKEAADELLTDARGKKEDWVQALDDVSVSAVGGGATGVHAETMIIKHLGKNIDNLYMAASQGACPACAGYMNGRKISHTGVRANGKVSSKWIHPETGMVCGTEVVTNGKKFSDVKLSSEYQWSK